MRECLSLIILLAHAGHAVASASLPVQQATPTAHHLYVATTGADTNPGSQLAPFRTIQHAADTALPSTTVHVAPGIYPENINTKRAGSAPARIRYLSDKKWGAQLIGSGTEATWTNAGDYTDIVDFDISGSGRLGILNYASHTRMVGNHVHHLMVSGGCTGSGGAGINNANFNSSDDDIEGNVVHDIGVPGKCSGVQGIYSSNLRGSISNNIVYRVSAWGIHLWHAANQVLISNNTIFANGSATMGGGIIMGTGDSPGSPVLSNTSVINNIVYKNPAASIVQFCYPGQQCIGKGNCIANNLVFANGGPIALRNGAALNTIEADPQFVDYQENGKGNYHLRKTSPAIKQGRPVLAPATDIDHMTRPRHMAPDIGAYETH
ncbi:MAG: right-handed parallel beta-helix repeat-containing protein [Pseudomonadota bacterium]